MKKNLLERFLEEMNSYDKEDLIEPKPSYTISNCPNKVLIGQLNEDHLRMFTVIIFMQSQFIAMVDQLQKMDESIASKELTIRIFIMEKKINLYREIFWTSLLEHFDVVEKQRFFLNGIDVGYFDCDICPHQDNCPIYQNPGQEPSLGSTDPNQNQQSPDVIAFNPDDFDLDDLEPEDDEDD